MVYVSSKMESISNETDSIVYLVLVNPRWIIRVRHPWCFCYRESLASGPRQIDAYPPQYKCFVTR